MKQLKKLEQVFGLQVGAVVKPSMGALGSRYRADRIFGGMYKIPADHKLLRMPDGKQSLGVMATNDDGSHAYIYLSDSLRHPIATSFIAAHEVAHLRGMHNHTDDENLREAVAVGQAVARFTPVLGRSQLPIPTGCALPQFAAGVFYLGYHAVNLPRLVQTHDGFSPLPNQSHIATCR